MEMQEEMENKQKSESVKQDSLEPVSKRLRVDEEKVTKQEAPKISKEDQQRLMMKIKDLYKQLPSKKESSKTCASFKSKGGNMTKGNLS